MKFKRSVGSLLVLCSLAMLPIAETGCNKSTLEPGGAYSPTSTNVVTGEVTATQAPDKEFFIADAAFYTAYSVIDAAFTFERDNRATLWQLDPNVKKTLDKIRPQAVTGKNTYLDARKAYLANPTPAGLSTLQTALGRLQQLQSAVSAVIPHK